MDCTRCGAAIENHGPCAYCGAATDVGPNALHHRIDEGFDVVRRSTPYLNRYSEARLSQFRSAAGPKSLFFDLIGPLILTGFGSFSLITVLQAREADIGVVVLGGFVALGVALVFKSVRRHRDRKHAPIQADAVKVLSRRSQQHRNFSTCHVTFEFEDGRRSEEYVRPRMYGVIADGDYGILYSQQNVVLGFDRVAV